MAANENHMAENGLPKIKHKMGSTVLDSFTRLTDNKDKQRIDAAVTLIRHLSQPDTQDQTESKELDYALARLVRGMGSSRVDARKGFFAALSGFLLTNPDIKVSRILDLVHSELKTVGSDSKSEKADIYTGQVLVCGALIHSKLLLKSTLTEQQNVLGCLINAGKQRSYLSVASYSFIVDLINQLEENDFKTIVWPLLKIETGRPWPEQTLDTLYALLVTNEKYPSIVKSKFIKKHLGSENIIDETSIPFLASLLMGLPMLMCLRHPVYKLFCEKLAQTELIGQFWINIDDHLSKPTRNKHLVAIEMMTFILLNIKDKTLVAPLLTPNFLPLSLRTLLTNKKKKSDEVVVKFKALLDLIVTTIKGDDLKPKTQVAVLKKLLFYPGDIMIEKTTGTKVIQMITMNLNAEGVKKLATLYREIAAATKPKDKVNSTEPWTNAERAYAAQLLSRLMGHLAVSSEDDWRLEQLKFLFEMGLCQSPTVGIELAPLMKETFYRALGQKLPKLNDLRTILSSLVHYLDSELFSDNDTSKLRMPFEESTLGAWKDMMKLITKLEGNPKNEPAVPIFHTMDLQMGLQLFSEPEMAINSIKELHSCFERIEKKKKRTSEEEPEWVEVVVDLLLSLLSRGSSLLRSVVGCVFPHMCQFLTPTAIYQILDVLDPKNDKNPLTTKEDSDSSDDEQNSDADEEHEDEDKEGSDAESSEEEISDSEIEEDMGDEDETINDRLRLAVRQALGDASAQTDDEDMDIDKIDEEEGKRLDHALAAAFKVLRENRQSRNKKQGKDAQALTHFRVRVIDLLEMYLDSNPSMALVVNLLLPLFALLEFCIKDQHQKPLENRIRACLKKLSSVKKFSDTHDVNDDLLTDTLRALIDKGSKSSSIYHEMGDKLAECCTFLVRCTQQIDATNNAIPDIYTESLTTFFKKRDCVLPAMLFKSVLHVQWIGNWKLAPLLLDFAFDNSIRPFRRSQALEFLNVFYHNNRLLQSDTEHAKIRLQMENDLCRNGINVLRELGAKKESEARMVVKQKFVCLLLMLLHVIRQQHQPKTRDWKAVGEAMAFYRSNVSLAKDAKSAYNRLASQLGIPVTCKKTQSEMNHTDDGELNDEENSEDNDKETKTVPPDEEADDDDEEDETKVKQMKKEKKKKQKSKSKQKDKQQLKKEARELRMKAMSDGLESLSFSSVPVHTINGIEEEMDDSMPVQNGQIDIKPKSKHNSKTHSVVKSAPKKRSTSESSDLPFKSSKKKK